MEAFLAAAKTALMPGEPGRPRLTEETVRLRQLEEEKKRLERELYEIKALSELQSRIIAIRETQLAEREKKPSDDLPVLRAVAAVKADCPPVPLCKFIRAGQFATATFFRYQHRSEFGQPLWGPRGKPRAVTAEDDMVKALLASQWRRQRHRTPGVAEAKAQYPELTEAHLQALVNEVRTELTREAAQAQISVQYHEPHLIWSMDIFERWYRGTKFHVLQVIDLGSRIKFDPAIKPGAFEGEEVACHVNRLMRQHGAPLFLKRDNGSNLNSHEVLELLNLFSVMAFNSPPGCPQFNGVMERSQGEIKRYLNVMIREVEEVDTFSAFVYAAVDRANHRIRPVLNGRTAQQVWEQEFTRFTKRERETIYEEIKELAAQIFQSFAAAKQQAKDAAAIVWRRAVLKWLEERGTIELFRDGKALRQATV